MLYSLILASAFASSNYPGVVEETAEMPCAPTCMLCHASASGGAGTVTADFGVAMMERGLTGGGAVDTLDVAFGEMVADAVDSDGDGVTDADELAGGEDPNPDGAAFCDVLTPTYGCFGTRDKGGAAALFGALLALGIGRRRK